MEIEFEYLLEDGQVLLEESELDRLCEETGLDEDEILGLVSEATSAQRRADAAARDAKIATINQQHEQDAKNAAKVERLKNGMDPENGTVPEEEIEKSLKQKAHLKINKVKKDVKEKKDEVKGKIKEKWDNASKGQKIAAGVIGGAAIAGAGYAGYKALKKRKARKEEEANKAEDVMIEYLIDEDAILICDEDLDFLMEASDYALSEEEIFERILEEVQSLLDEEGGKYGFGTQKAAVHGVTPEMLDTSVSPSKMMNQKFENVHTSNPKTIKSVTKGKYEKAKKAAKGMGGKALDWAKDHKGLTAAGAIGAAGLVAGGIAGARALKKRKAQKEQEQAMKAEDVMIEYLIDEDCVLICDEDLDFLMEANNFNLSEEEVLEFLLDEIISEEGGKYGFGTQKAAVHGVTPEMLDTSVSPSKMMNQKFENVHTSNPKTVKSVAKGKFEKAKNATKGLAGKALDYAKDHKGVVALGALGTAGAVAGGVAAARALKKRKAQKEQEQAMKAEDVMIDFYLVEDTVYILDEDMQFILEATDYEVTQSEVFEDLIQVVSECIDNNILLDEAGGKYGFGSQAAQVAATGGNIQKPDYGKKIHDVEELRDLVGKGKVDLSVGGGIGAGAFQQKAMQGIKALDDKDAATQAAKDAADKAKETAAGEKVLSKLEKEKNKAKKKKERDQKRYERSVKMDELKGKAKDFYKDHKKGVIAAGVLGGAALAGAGYAGYKALKKRKAQKEAEKANKAEDVMIQYLVSEGSIYLIEDDLDFLLEATNYELTEEDIMFAICEAAEVKLELPGDGVKVVTSEKELAKVPEKQEEDIEDGPDMDDENDAVRTNGGEISVRESYEYDEFAETWEGDHIIMEAVLEDMDIELSESEMYEMIDQHLLSERSIVKLDKQAKRSHAEKKALMVIAREQNDPLYRKLDKLYKQRRAILNQLDEKYGSRAIARVRSAKSKAKQVKDED